MMIKDYCYGQGVVCGEGLKWIGGVGDQGEQWWVGKRRTGQGEEKLRVRGFGGERGIGDQGGG